MAWCRCGQPRDRCSPSERDGDCTRRERCQHNQCQWHFGTFVNSGTVVCGNRSGFSHNAIEADASRNGQTVQKGSGTRFRG